MALGGKKVSFGFSKVSKQNSILKHFTAAPKEKVEYVDCLDSKTIVCKEIEDVAAEEKIDFVIPMKRTADQNVENLTVEQRNNIVTENTKEHTLEEKAIEEILDAAKKADDVKEEAKNLHLVIQSLRQRSEASESTFDDYENVPIGDFGTAMLRGMGWKAGTGTNKSGKVFSGEVPEVRPRGVALGAYKTASTTIQKTTSNEEEEELKVVIGAYVQITFGSMKGHYGQIEGFDSEGSGRIMIKIAMQAPTISVNEFGIKLVTKEEYEKSSRVLNACKYEEYKLRSEAISKSKQSDSGREHHIEDSSSTDNMSDFEKRRENIDRNSDDEQFVKKKKYGTDTSSEVRSDESDRRRHKTERSSNDDERKKHRIGSSSTERSDDDRKKKLTSRSYKNKSDNNDKIHKTKKSSVKKYVSEKTYTTSSSSPERSDDDRKKHGTGRRSEDKLDDNNRRDITVESFENRNVSGKMTYRTRSSSPESSDDVRERHETSGIFKDKSSDRDRKHKTERSSEDRNYRKRHGTISSLQETSDDSEKRWHKMDRISEDNNERKRHRKDKNSDDGNRRQYRRERISDDRFCDSDRGRFRRDESFEDRLDNSERRRQRKNISFEESEKRRYRSPENFSRDRR